MNNTAAKAGEFAEYSSATRWIILTAVMLGTLMQVIDSSIVNVAVPQMMGNLGATTDQISWVTTGYIIANVILLPLTGWLSSRFGRKHFLAASMILFTVASFFCGTSRTLNELVFFRVLQGAGGAALLSTAQATIMEIFPPAQLGMVQAIYGIGVMVGPTVGPTLGGWITDNYSWPWTFFINIPIGIIATILVVMFVHDSKYESRKVGRVDFIGIALLAMGLGAFQTILEKGNSEGWFDSALIIRLSIAAAVGLIGFVVWELWYSNPAVNLRVLKNKSLAAGTIFGTAVGFGLYGGIFILPIFLQQMRHYTAQQTGIIMLPGAIATTIAMPIVGKLVSKVAARSMVFWGSIGVVISMVLLSQITLDTGPEHMFWALVIRGASLGFLFVPLTIASLSGLRGKDMADASGLFNLARQIGGSTGIAFLSTYLSHMAAVHRGTLVENITPYNPLAQQRLQALQAFFMSKGSSLAAAKQQALTTLDRIVQGQASIKGFEDVFMISAIIFTAAIPLVLLMKKNGNAATKGGPPSE